MIAIILGAEHRRYAVGMSFRNFAAPSYLWTLFLVFACATPYSPPKPPLPAPEVTAPATPEVFGTMNQVRDHVIRLMNRTSPSSKNSSIQERAETDKLIQALAEDARDITQHSSLQAPTYHLSSLALANHFKDVQTSYRARDMGETHRLLGATPMICASCHMQLPTNPTLLWPEMNEGMNGTALEKADFLLAAQDYLKAESIYTRGLREYPNSGFEYDDLEHALRRKLAIYLRIRRDFVGAQKSLKQDSLNASLPNDILQSIAKWQSDLTALSRRAWFGKLPRNSESLISWTDEVLKKSGPNPRAFLVEDLYLSGLVFEYLHRSNVDKHTPDLLYRLALLEFRMSDNDPFALSLSYLRECMDRFPKSSTAKRCYEAFEIQLRQKHALQNLSSEDQRELRERKIKLSL